MDSTARKISAVPPPQPAEVPDEAARELFYYMVLARAMEERALNLYRQGKLPGSYYTGRGQEAISVGMALPLLKAGGVLFASSNATGWPAEVFVNCVEMAVRGSKRTVLQRHYAPQPPDFPITKAEPAYLKTLWLKIT